MVILYFFFKVRVRTVKCFGFYAIFATYLNHANMSLKSSAVY